MSLGFVNRFFLLFFEKWSMYISMKNEIDMLNGKLAGKILRFAAPLAATAVLQQLFNAADIAVVGQFASSNAMAAVGSNASVISLMVSLFLGLSVGANVIVANLIGSGQKSKIHEAVHTTIAVSLIIGFSLIGVFNLVAKPLLTAMGAPAEVMDLAVLYLRVYSLAMPGIMLYNFGSAILRSKGDSRRPLLALMASGVINIVLNLLFVIVFHLHVAGVALATAISNMISAGLVILFLVKEEEPFRLSFRKLSIKKRYLKGILAIGLPAGVQGMVFSFSNVIIQSTINSFGPAAIAGSTAAQNMEFMSYCIINAFGQTAVTFTSQNYASGKVDRCKKIFRITMALGIGLDLIAVALMMLFRYPLLSLFTGDPEVLHYAMIRMFYVCMVHFLIGSYEISGGALRGMNHSLLPALISILGTCGFRLVWVFALVRPNHDFTLLMAVYPASWIFTGTIMLISYFVVRHKAFSMIQKTGP